ncbi:uncharacterized protein LOC116201061 [Punica granatum]|nr:uncharacterized protein LOC116201061 [Punica granatum]PKI77602.1 hypothetical protein CRG98_002004 [Punica granatum]
MSSSKRPPPPPPPPLQPSPFYYTPLPPQPQDDHQDYVVLLPYRPTSRRCMLCLASLIMMIILSPLIIYISWPSDPDLKIVRMRLNRVRIHRSPRLLIDASISLTIKVRNPDIYSLGYQTLDASVGYRGKDLGYMRSDGGHVRALGSSYMDAELELESVDLLTDVVDLLEDLAKGTVPFDTVTEITGQLGLLFLEFPLKAKVSCEILVNTRNQTFVRKNCHPE